MLLFALVEAAALSGLLFYHHSSHVLYADSLLTSTRASTASCATQCGQHRDCTSFSYHPTRRECVLYSREVGEGDAGTPDVGLQSYVTPGRIVSYEVTVSVPDVHYSGTDAEVFIQLYGSSFISKRLVLVNDGLPDFERNTNAIFQVSDINVGEIKKIRFGHDGTGVYPDFVVDQIIVRRPLSSIDAKRLSYSFELTYYTNSLRMDISTQLEIELTPETKLYL